MYVFIITVQMKSIAIDASRYKSDQPTGVEVYADQLIPRLIQRAQKEKVQIEMLSPTLPANPDNGVRWVNFGPSRLWTLLGMSWALLSRKVRSSVLFVPSHILPLILLSRSYLTIHDVAYRYFPQSYSLFQRMLLEFSTWFAVHFATGIICVSQQTAQDLRRFYKCPEKKLHTIYSGFDMHAFRSSFLYKEEALSSWNVQPQKYFFFVGRVEEKKNVPMLVRAFLKADLPMDIKLLIVGKPGVGYEQVTKELEADIYSRVVLTGYMDNDTTYSLMQHALAFVFPSRFEGFGFPVLEAYSLSVPVVCTPAGALQEVAGDAAMYVHNEKELTSSLESVASSGFPREEYICRGLKQLEHFSWEKTADDVWTVINS